MGALRISLFLLASLFFIVSEQAKDGQRVQSNEEAAECMSRIWNGLRNSDDCPLSVFMDESLYLQFKAYNESQKKIKAERTPAAFFMIVVTIYIFSLVFRLFGLYTIAHICNHVIGVWFLMFMLWLFIRYSGEFSELGTQIEELATAMWENVMLSVRLVHKLRYLILSTFFAVFTCTFLYVYLCKPADDLPYFQLMKPLYQPFVKQSVSVTVQQDATTTANGKMKLP